MTFNWKLTPFDTFLKENKGKFIAVYKDTGWTSHHLFFIHIDENIKYLWEMFKEYGNWKVVDNGVISIETEKIYTKEDFSKYYFQNPEASIKYSNIEILYMKESAIKFLKQIYKDKDFNKLADFLIFNLYGDFEILWLDEVVE